MIALARLPGALLGLTVVLVTAMVALSLGGEPLFDTVLYGLLALAFGQRGRSSHRGSRTTASAGSS